MTASKTPDSDAPHPAPGGHKPRMAPLKDAPPGLEQDGKGDVIPLDRRTAEDREKAISGRK